MRPAPIAAPPHRKIVIFGLVLLLVGFFLPWFDFNPQRVVNDSMARVPWPAEMPNLRELMPQAATLYFTGGDIAHGLGWCVLLLGLGAAALPYFAVNLNREVSQKTSLGALGLGAIILLYLLTQNLRFASVGLLLGLAGYTLEFIGFCKSGAAERGLGV
jgi:hypothetical protein